MARLYQPTPVQSSMFRYFNIRGTPLLPTPEGGGIRGEEIDEFPGTDVVDVEQTEDLIPPASDVSREESTEPGEFENVKLPGADLDGKDRDRLDQRQASDQQLGSRLADDPIHRVGAEFGVIMLDQGAAVEKVAGHQKRSARSSSMTTRAMESLIVEVPARTSSRVMLSSASFVQEAMAS